MSAHTTRPYVADDWDYKPPTEWDGVQVEFVGQVMTIDGESWLSLYSVEDDDPRVWEFSLTHGRTVRTV